MANVITKEELAAFVASLNGDHGDLDARIQEATHTVVSSRPRVKLRAHYLKFRDGKATVGEFVNAISRKFVRFCLSRKAINEAQEGWALLTDDKKLEHASELYQRAVELFKKANRRTSRNGEFGELITYLLIEHILKAPQVVAKMSLKTNSQMPVHGSDGIHLSYDIKSGRLFLFWGESKCYKSVAAAISKAVESLAENLEHQKMQHELYLVRDHFDWPGLDAPLRAAVLDFLDPYSESYNQRVDVSVVFIAFDFAGFANLKGIAQSEIEKTFVAELATALSSYAIALDTALEKASVSDHAVEVFFLPVPSVEELRALFQDKIGWTK